MVCLLFVFVVVVFCFLFCFLFVFCLIKDDGQAKSVKVCRHKGNYWGGGKGGGKGGNWKSNYPKLPPITVSAM